MTSYVPWIKRQASASILGQNAWVTVITARTSQVREGREIVREKRSSPSGASKREFLFGVWENSNNLTRLIKYRWRLRRIWAERTVFKFRTYFFVWFKMQVTKTQISHYQRIDQTQFQTTSARTLWRNSQSPSPVLLVLLRLRHTRMTLVMGPFRHTRDWTNCLKDWS